MIKIENATTNDIHIIRHIADETWWPTYSAILTDEQINFMLNAIYSTEALQEVMKNGSQTFIILSDQRGPQGFASYGVKNNELAVGKLHKIYVLPENHGRGYGKLLIEEVKKRIVAMNVYTLDLNVNRYNPARTFYEKIGFKFIKEEDVPIGPYWMNDFVMRLEMSASSL